MSHSPTKKSIKRLLGCGNLEKAKKLCYQRSLKHRHDPDTWALMAQIYEHTAEWNAAHQAWSQAVNFSPNNTEYLLGLGRACQQLNNLLAAEAALKHALSIDMTLTDAHFHLGMIKASNGNYNDAISYYKHTLSLQPSHFSALANLGGVYYSLGNYDAANDCYHSALKLQPDNAMLYCNMAIALIPMGKRADAIKNCKRAINLQPKLCAAHVILGNAFMAMGQFESALGAYYNGLSTDPCNMDALVGEINALERLGKTDTAFSKLTPLIDAGHGNIGLLISYASLSPPGDKQLDAAKRIEQRISQGALTCPQKIELRFSAGRLYDEIGQHAQAFPHYERGNQLAAGISSNTSPEEEFRHIARIFDTTTYNHLPRASIKTTQPIFIVGMPRSGTSLVERIIASHPDVYGAGELSYIMDLCHNSPGLPGVNTAYPDCFSDLTADSANSLAASYLARIDSLAGNSERVTDKMPHNFIHLGAISILFPNARIIHCTRNPIDTCLSCYFQRFASGHEYAYNLETLGNYYNHYHWLMRHWENVGVPMLEVNYENLAGDFDKNCRRIISYCDLPWDDACLEYHAARHQTRTASYRQTRQPIYQRSRGRWQNYEEHIQPLINILQAAKHSEF